MKGIPLLYENELCLVFNKPSGLSAQGGEGVKVSLDSLLSEAYSPRPLLVHRLDKDTSGVILVAKTKEAAGFFSALFSGGKTGTERPIVRQYLGVCSGTPAEQEGVIRLDLDARRDGLNGLNGQKKAKQKSETFYRCLSTADAGFTDGEASAFSLLELELGTGRMHQIRRHLAMLGHPLLGDDKYGDFSLNRRLWKTAGIKHLLLHASRLSIPPSPEFPGGLDVTAPLPDYFPCYVPQ